MAERRRASRFLLLLAAVLGGGVFPLQGRINAELSEETGDVLFASLISFAAGLLVMVFAVVLSARGRAAWHRVRPALRERTVRWWHLLVGGIGVTIVLGQVLTIGVLGVVVFSVMVIAGQMLGAMAWDHLGLTPAGRRRLSLRRLTAGAVMVLALVLMAVPHVGGTGSGALLVLVLVPLLAGVAGSGQQVVNAVQSAAYRSALPATLINYTAGSALLILLWGGVMLASAFAGGAVSGPELSAVWWHYLGGPLGCIFIGVGAALVVRLGALIVGLGLIAGQLGASLLLDLWWPAPGAAVTVWTVAGVMLAFLATVVAVRERSAGEHPGKKPFTLR